MDSIGSNIEDPFENTIPDTPTTALCRTTVISQRHVLGDEDLPAPVELRHGVLL